MRIFPKRKNRSPERTKEAPKRHKSESTEDYRETGRSGNIKRDREESRKARKDSSHFEEQKREETRKRYKPSTDHDRGTGRSRNVKRGREGSRKNTSHFNEFHNTQNYRSSSRAINVGKKLCEARTLLFSSQKKSSKLSPEEQQTLNDTLKDTVRDCLKEIEAIDTHEFDSRSIANILNKLAFLTKYFELKDFPHAKISDMLSVLNDQLPNNLRDSKRSAQMISMVLDALGRLHRAKVICKESLDSSKLETIFSYVGQIANISAENLSKIISGIGELVANGFLSNLDQNVLANLIQQASSRLQDFGSGYISWFLDGVGNLCQFKLLTNEIINYEIINKFLAKCLREITEECFKNDTTEKGKAYKGALPKQVAVALCGVSKFCSNYVPPRGADNNEKAEVDVDKKAEENIDERVIDGLIQWYAVQKSIDNLACAIFLNSLRVIGAHFKWEFLQTIRESLIHFLTRTSIDDLPVLNNIRRIFSSIIKNNPDINCDGRKILVDMAIILLKKFVVLSEISFEQCETLFSILIKKKKKK